MSENRWFVNEHCRKFVHMEPRGQTASVLVGLDLDCTEPLTAETQARAMADIGERLKPQLPAHPDIQRYAALRLKLAEARRQQQQSELYAKQLEAEKQRLLLGALADGQAERLAQIEAELRSTSHSASNWGGLARGVEGELAKARPAAERALRHALVEEGRLALERYCARRDELLAEICRVAAPLLDELALAVQAIRQAAMSGEGLYFQFRHLLDEIGLPDDAPKDAAPLPTPTVMEAPQAEVSGTVQLPIAGGALTQTTMPAPQPLPEPPAVAASAPGLLPQSITRGGEGAAMPTQTAPQAAATEETEARSKGRRPVRAK